MTNAVAAMMVEIRDHLKRRPLEAVRPVPLAQAIGSKDISRVREALRTMRDRSELVSCVITVPGLGNDEEFRLAASGGAIAFNNTTLKVEPALRRPDTSGAIPSRFVSTTAPPIDRDGDMRVRNPRQRAIIEYIERVDRNVGGRELLNEFRKTDPALSAGAVWCALGEMAASGRLVECARVATPGSRQRSRTYATPAIAERLKSNPSAIAAEPTPPEHAVPGKAAAETAAPLVPVEAPRKTVRQELMPRAEFDAQSRLITFFTLCDRNWFGLPSLVRHAGGDVPATLEALARLQRDGRLNYSEADRAPIWHPVEGCW